MNAPERATFLERRKAGLGGSDVAAVLGLSQWKTPYDVWAEKTGTQIDEQIGNAEAMYWGMVLEDVVAKEYATRSGNKVQRVNTMLRHPQHDWMIGNIDRAVVVDGSRARIDAAGKLQGAKRLLECKTASAYKASDWAGPDGSDAMPIYYTAQVMWYLAITGLDVCDVAVLIGGQQYQQRSVERDDETIRSMVERTDAFWRHNVLGGNPPEAVNARDMARIFTRDDGTMREIGDDAELLVTLTDLRAAREKLKTAEERADALSDALRMAIGERAGLAVDGKPCVTWRAAKSSERTDWEALAKFLNPQPDTIAQFTKTVPGSRRFLLSK